MKHKLFGLIVTLLLAIPLTANAHEELVDQYPEPGATLEAGVHELRLTFTNDLLELAGGAGNEIVISDPDGNIFYAGCLPTSGPDGILPLDLEAAGTYTVAWRVVSADGHPISEGFEFQVINQTGYKLDPAFAYPDCAGEVDIDLSQEPQSLYWLLWSSLGLAAALLVFLLRPKARPSKNKQSED